MKSLTLVLVLIIVIVLVHGGSSKLKKCLRECKKKGFKLTECFDACETVLVTTESFKVEQDVEETKKPALRLDSKKIWESYTTEVFRFIKRGVNGKSTLQILKEPIVANWDQDINELQNICNSISKFGSIVYNVTNALVPNEYEKFLNNLKISTPSISPSDIKRIQELEAKYKEAQYEVQAQTDKCEKNYIRMKERIPSTDRETFFKTRCNVLQRALDIFYIEEFNLEQAKRRIEGPDTEKILAIQDFKNAKEYTWGEYMNSLATFKKQVSEGKSTRLGISIIQKYDTSTTISDYAEVNFGNSTFINITSSKYPEDYSLKTTADRFQVEVIAPGYTAIHVSPKGTWLHYDILKSVAKSGPFIDITKNNIGPNKALPWLVQTIHVVFQPSISLYLNEEDANYFASLKSIKKNIKIGPFTCETASIHVEAVEEGLQKVKFITEAKPYIIAIDHEML